jgi:hypothetical protein
MSLDKDAPLENHAAVGWHSLEVRGGELWATNVEWADCVRAGLSKDPPEWKYFSPAYDIDPKTDEVVSYLNTALTNNPATHNVTALASRGAATKGTSPMDEKKEAMTWGDIKAALDGDDEDKKAAAYAAIQAAFPPMHDEPDGDEGKKEEKKAAEDEPDKKDAEDDADKKDAEDDADKKDAVSLAASLDSDLRAVKAELAAFRAERDNAERSRLIASREMSLELAKKLSSKSLALVKEIVETLPVKKSAPKSTETVQATRGANAESRASKLSPAERTSLDEQMGLSTKKASIHWDRSSRVFPVNASKETK